MTSPGSASSPSERDVAPPNSGFDIAALAIELVAAAAGGSPLYEGAEALRRATKAHAVTVRLWRPTATPILAGEPVAETHAAGGQPPLEIELWAGDRLAARVALTWAAGDAPHSHEAAAGAAQLLLPLVLLEESRRTIRDEHEERALRLAEQQRFISMIVDSLPVGLYVVDRDYRIRVWNRGREKGLQGVAREDALGRSIFEILHRQPAEQLRRELDEVMRTGEIATFEAESSAFGAPRSYRLSKIPMRFDGSGVTHVIAIGEDITDWKQAQLRSMRAEKLAAVGQLAAGVMHEVNNPLATIAACAETLAHDLREGETPDHATLEELVRIIDHEVHRCRRLVDDLLGFCRQSPSERSVIEMEQLIDETLALLAHHARFRRARVRRERAVVPLPLVDGSREQLMQVLMAVLLNAVDATAAGGEIIIRTRTLEEQVIVEVADTGEGIPPEEIARIFEPFYTTKPPGQGTGLGLAISYGIITDHGGRLDVDSALGTGSTFSVVLPTLEGE